MNFAKWWKDKHPEIMGTPEISERDFDLMRDAWETATLEEREACAKVCVELDTYEPEIRKECAEAIRMRSNV